MNKIVLVLIASLLFGYASAKAQTKDDTDVFIEQLFKDIRAKNYNTLYDRLSPSCQTHIPKEYMIALFDNIEKNEKYTNDITAMTIKDKSRTTDYEKVLYTLVEYVLDRKITYNSKASKEFIEEYNAVYEKLKPLKQDYDLKKKTLSLSQKYMIIVVADKTEASQAVYSFIPYTPRLLPYMTMLMPQEAVNNLLKY